jgi:hypothetical protein
VESEVLQQRLSFPTPAMPLTANVIDQLRNLNREEVFGMRLAAAAAVVVQERNEYSREEH